MSNIDAMVAKLVEIHFAKEPILSDELREILLAGKEPSEKKDAPAVIKLANGLILTPVVKPEAKPECKHEWSYGNMVNAICIKCGVEKPKPSSTEGQGIDEMVEDLKRWDEYGGWKYMAEQILYLIRSHSLPKDKILIDRKLLQNFIDDELYAGSLLRIEIKQALGAERGSK